MIHWSGRVRGITPLLLLAAASRVGAQTEHRSLTGDRVAIYNLAGRVRLQPASGGSVTVDVSRGGRDAGRLTIATGEIRGFQTLRVIYPSNQIVYPEFNHRTRTQMRVDEDGTFDDRNSGRDWRGGDRVEIRDSGSGLDAHADLVVGVPKGQRIVVHWASAKPRSRTSTATYASACPPRRSSASIPAARSRWTPDRAASR